MRTNNGSASRSGRTREGHCRAWRLLYSDILSDVSLAIGPGEVCGLVGPNGAGKSTTVGVITGLVPITSGRIRVLGGAPVAARARLGVLAEENGLYGWMSAPEYLCFFATLRGTGDDPAALLAAVGLAPRRGQRVATFSRGMRQRLGLARALIGEPAVLVLDEPTNGLDPRGRRELHDLLRDRSQRAGCAILVCTHLLDDVDRLCDRTVFLVDGRVVASGRTAELAASGDRAARYRLVLAPGWGVQDAPAGLRIVSRESDSLIVELSDATESAEMWRTLIAAGWPLREVVGIGGGLEALYLRLTDGPTQSGGNQSASALPRLAA